MPRILIRASKSPFDNFYNGPIPIVHLKKVYKALNREGTKNIGNLVFAHSAYKALSSPDNDLAIDDYMLSLSREFADRSDEINSEFSSFVLPMCNSFRVSYRETLEMMAATLKKIRIPCVVTGVGAQTKLNGDFSQLNSIESEVKAFVSAVLDTTASIGVRGEFTRDYLVSLGFHQDSIDVIGCPSMFYNGDSMNVVKKHDSPSRVAINLSKIKDPKILKFTDFFDKSEGDIIYIPQVRDLMMKTFHGNFPDESAINNVDDPLPHLRLNDKVRFLCDVVPWIDFMRPRSFAIGTRIHGNVVALLAGTPAHVIVHDSRTLELARYFEIPHTLLSDLSNFDIAQLYEKSSYHQLNGNHARRARVYADFLERNGLAHTVYDEQSRHKYDDAVRTSLEHPILEH